MIKIMIFGLKFMINQKKIQSWQKIRIKASMLRSDLCDFSGAYIVVQMFRTTKTRI